MVARHDDELAVLTDVSVARRGDVILLDAAGVVARVPVGADVGQLFPDVAEAARVTRCSLRMLQVENPTGRQVDPPRPAASCP